MFFLSDFRWIWALSVCVSKVLVRGSSLPDFVPVLLIFFWASVISFDFLQPLPVIIFLSRERQSVVRLRL
jgi:hypothetical protein